MTDLKVHKIENFFDSDFGICVISLLVLQKNILFGPLLGKVRFFRVVLGLRWNEKKFELGQNKFFLLLQLWTLNMTQYYFLKIQSIKCSRDDFMC
jgi:hypothetical protein